MNPSQRPTRPGLGGWIFRRIVPVLLLLVLVYTLAQAAGAGADALSASQRAATRQPAYAATATALAGEAPRSSLRLVAQFATNTPSAPLPAATPLPQSTQETAAAPTPFIAPTFFPPSDPAVAAIAGTAVPTRVPLIPRPYELVNIMLLGSDDEVSADSTIRTDTMIVVSINTEARTVALLSLPRDLFVYVPTPTMTRLNTVYGMGEAFGWQGGGWGLLRETIFYNFGINVHYHAIVNFSGFEQIIDTVGGVVIAVDCTYEDWYPKETIDPSLPVEQNYELRRLPVGIHHFNGFDALWYARTRRLTDDFDRGRRQQQVLRAIYRAALSQGLLTSLPQLWPQLTEVVQTDIPFDVVLGLLPIALEINPDDLETYTLIRTYHTLPWQPTEGAYAGQFVQLPSYEPIRQLLTAFYQPPTRSRIDTQQVRVRIYNGSGNLDWDRVAAYKLRERGLLAVAGGVVDPQPRTTVVDLMGDERAGILPVVLRTLNLTTSAVTVQPNPGRSEDFRVVLGADYDSCTGNVLPPEQALPAGG